MLDIHAPAAQLQQPQRLRRTAGLRRLTRETRLTPDDFVLPLFVTQGENVRNEVSSMPGVFQMSVDKIVERGREAVALGVPAVLLFGLPAHKDASGSSADADGEAVQEAVRALKKDVPELVVITDVCLCEYTDHGHCGVFDTMHDSLFDMPATLARHADVAVSHARAGADVVAPSGMFDGLVAALRAALDAAGFAHVPILSYAVKYASAFYGPFRDAAGSVPAFGDRRAHQMDPANAREALREAALDVEAGADMLMVKPAIAYLDIIYRLRVQHPDRPLAAYHVSGEYAMLKAAARNGWLDERRAALEALTAIKRAGADFILTYYALDAARWLREDAESVS